MRTNLFSWFTKLYLAGQAYRPSKFEQYVLPLLVMFVLATNPAFAAGGATAAMSKVATTVIGIVNIAFTIGLAIGLIRTVWKFFQNAPDALGSVGWLVGGVILWFAFQLFKDELASAIGGTGGITN